MAEDTLSVPLSAVRIKGDEALVFLVNEGGIVETMPVQAGSVLGEYIVISGLSADLEIIEDIGGVEEGDIVEIRNSK